MSLGGNDVHSDEIPISKELQTLPEESSSAQYIWRTQNRVFDLSFMLNLGLLSLRVSLLVHRFRRLSTPGQVLQIRLVSFFRAHVGVVDGCAKSNTHLLDVQVVSA